MRMPRLSRSGIEYLDYAWNFYSGCEHWATGICLVPNCWARNITQRFPANYPNGFEPTFYPEAFFSPLSLKKPSRIGVCFMGDLFGDWVDPFEGHGQFGEDEHGYFTLKGRILDTIQKCPQHTFLFLTKAPGNYRKWGQFPDNCWLGASCWDEESMAKACLELAQSKARIKWLSLEPFLGKIISSQSDRIIQKLWQTAGMKWLVIGAQTNPYKPPKIQWVKQVTMNLEEAGIPYFLKNNLYDLFWEDMSHLRQEFPVST